MNQSVAYAIIPARGGSKRLPGKNIKQLGGKPLIAYMIEAARSATLINDFAVSTDDDQIEAVVRDLGCHVIRRPEELCGDGPSEAVVAHGISFLEEKNHKPCDFVLTLQATSPFCLAAHLDQAIEKLNSHADWDSVSTVSLAKQRPEWMFRLEEKSLRSVSQYDFSGDNNNSQKLESLYYPTGACTATRRSYFFATGRALAEKAGALIVDEIESLDIDTTLDFELAEWLLKKGVVKF